MTRNKNAQARLLASAAILAAAISATALSCAAHSPALTENFYESVNAEWLAAHAAPPPGMFLYTTFSEVDCKNQARLIELLDGLATAQNPAGTAERRLGDFWAAGLDIAKRNESGWEPLKPYIEAYRSAKSIAELVDADRKALDGCGSSQLLSFDIFETEDGVARVAFRGPMPIGYAVYGPGKERTAYKAYLERLFALTGSSKAEAKTKAKLVYDFELELATSAQPAKDTIDPSKAIPYPFYLFRTIYPGVDFPAFFAARGAPSPESFSVADQKLFEKGAALFDERHRDALAAYAEARLLIQETPALSEDFIRERDECITAVLGSKSSMGEADWNKKMLLQTVEALFPEELGKMYAERYCSPETKKDVTEIVDRVRAVYRDEIEHTGWMGDRTKKAALAKLDAMTARVGYPETWEDPQAETDIRPLSSGGSFFGNYAEASRTRVNAAWAKLGKKTGRNRWTTPVYVVNAFNAVWSNEIVIPAGVLQPPFYDKNAPEAANLGGIGMIIAHEISHSFDSIGAKYDAKGEQRYWWTQADERAFNERISKVRAFYDGQKNGLGIVENGELTQSEHMADLMAMQCALKIIALAPAPDYREFFAAYATTFRGTATKQAWSYLSKADPHGMNEIRVNRTVSNFAEFDDAFGVKTGDRMYIAPGNRIRLW